MVINKWSHDHQQIITTSKKFRPYTNLRTCSPLSRYRRSCSPQTASLEWRSPRRSPRPSPTLMRLKLSRPKKIQDINTFWVTVKTNATISSESLESVEVPGCSQWWIDKLQDHDRNRLPLKYSFQLLSVFDRHKMEQHLNLISGSHQGDSQEFYFPSIFASHYI